SVGGVPPAMEDPVLLGELRAKAELDLDAARLDAAHRGADEAHDPLPREARPGAGLEVRIRRLHQLPSVATSGNGKPLKLLAYAGVEAPVFLMKMKSPSCRSAGKSSSRITTSTESHVGPATFQLTGSPSRSV